MFFLPIQGNKVCNPYAELLCQDGKNKCVRNGGKEERGEISLGRQMSAAENKKVAGCGLCMEWEEQPSHGLSCIPNRI